MRSFALEFQYGRTGSRSVVAMVAWISNPVKIHNFRNWSEWNGNFVKMAWGAVLSGVFKYIVKRLSRRNAWQALKREITVLLLFFFLSLIMFSCVLVIANKIVKQFLPNYNVLRVYITVYCLLYHNNKILQRWSRCRRIHKIFTVTISEDVFWLIDIYFKYVF